MQKEATAHEADDKQKKEEAEIRNQADNLAYSAEKTIKDMGDKVDSATKEKVEKGITELRKELSDKDSAKIKSAFESLQKDVYEMSSQVYKAQSQEGQQGPQAPEGQPSTGDQGQQTGGGEDKTINADWKESENK